MLNRGNRRVCPDGIGPGHVTYSVKKVRKGSFPCYNVPELGNGVRESCWGDCTPGQQRIGLGAVGKGAFDVVEHLMVLEEGEIDGVVCPVVLK